MEIIREAVAGSLESSDVMVTVSPADDVRIELNSSVEQYYGDSIRSTMREVLKDLGVEHVRVEAVDHGALDCTIRARLTTALKRASKEVEKP